MACFEKTTDTLDDLLAQWEQVDVAELTELQTTRVRDAIAAWKERVARSRVGSGRERAELSISLDV